MNAIEFKAWPKTPRIFRNAVITEKIDGTNAAIGIRQFAFGWHAANEQPPNVTYTVGPRADDGFPVHEYLVYAQSRTRIITPDADNYGFAAWVYANAATLAEDLGPGLHYGEWWGFGINRCYGMRGRMLSLFNAAKWTDTAFRTPFLGAVPVISQGTFNTAHALSALDYLRDNGSLASPGFMNPEGICIYHAANSAIYKATLDNDAQPKSVAELVSAPSAANRAVTLRVAKVAANDPLTEWRAA